MKTITICGKEHKIECNAFTYVQYRKIFNNGIFEDIGVIKDYIITQTENARQLKKDNPDITELELSFKLEKLMISKIDIFIEAVTKIAYILIYSADDKIEDYEAFLKEIKNFKIDDEWIAEVTEFAVDCFC